MSNFPSRESDTPEPTSGSKSDELTVIKKLRQKRIDRTLYSACANDDIDKVKEMLECGARMNTQYTQMQFQAVHISILRGHVRCLQMVLDWKADVNAPIKTLDLPLHLAARKGDLAAVGLLLQYCANPCQTGQDKKPPLDSAAFMGRGDIVSSLIEAKSDPNQSDDQLRTPIITASWRGYPSVVKILIESNAFVDWCDKWGATACHFAANEGNLGCLKTLVQARACVSIPTNETGSLPIHFAVKNDKMNTLQYLATTITPKIEATRRKITDLLNRNYAIHRLSKSVIRLLAEFICGVDLEIKTNEGETILDLAQSEEMRKYINDIWHDYAKCS